jgi:hypothetical protein
MSTESTNKEGGIMANEKTVLEVLEEIKKIELAEMPEEVAEGFMELIKFIMLAS